jgi:hypothetical protein
VRRGIVPVVVDRSQRPQGLVPGSIHLRAPIDDAEAILAALRERPRDLDCVAVLTSTDLGVASVPRVAAALGLAHASPESVALMNDKLLAKERLTRAGVRVPRGTLLRVGDALPFGDAGEELVVKPVDSSGSRGVSRVRGRTQIERAVEGARAFSERVLVEECVEGRHFDVNGVVREGRFELVTVGHRFFSPPPACVPLYGGIPSRDDEALASRLTTILQRAVEAFDYRHGPIKFDLIEDESGIVVIEAAARFHGDVFSDHTLRAAGRAPAAIRWLARSGFVELEAESPSRFAGSRRCGREADSGSGFRVSAAAIGSVRPATIAPSSDTESCGSKGTSTTGRRSTGFGAASRSSSAGSGGSLFRRAPQRVDPGRVRARIHG